MELPFTKEEARTRRRQSCSRVQNSLLHGLLALERSAANPSVTASAEVSLCRAPNNPGSALTCPSDESVALAGRPRFLGPPTSPRPSLAGCCSCQPQPRPGPRQAPARPLTSRGWGGERNPPSGWVPGQVGGAEQPGLPPRPSLSPREPRTASLLGRACWGPTVRALSGFPFPVVRL